MGRHRKTPEDGGNGKKWIAIQALATTARFALDLWDWLHGDGPGPFTS